MIWKTTLAFLVALINKLEEYSITKKILRIPVLSILAILGFSGLGNAQTCEILEYNCPPTDITITCGSEVEDSEVENKVYGNYVTWTPPTYELDCGTGDGDAFQMSFDLPESSSTCWIFKKVQRVGTNNGTLNLWKSDGNASGTAEVTTPAFYVDGETSGSMHIFAAPGQTFTTSVYLVNSEGVKSNLMDSFVVDPSTTIYDFNINPNVFEGTNSYRLKFEFNGGTNNASYVDLITFDANLFGNSCSGDVNFSVTSNYVPNDFFPIGSTEVIYTATCLGCSPVITNTCSFNVIVNPIPATPVAVDIVQPNCEESLGSVEVVAEEGMQYSIDGENYSISALFENLGPNTYYITSMNSDGCESTPLEVVINSQPETPVTPEITATNADCDNENGSITVANYDSNLTYILVNSQGDTQYAINQSGVFTEVAPDSYTVRVENANCNATSASATIEDSEQTPVTPEITATNADCDNENGSITVANYDSNLTYILVDSQGDTQYAINESGVFTEVAPDSYTVRVENADCNATSASATIEDSEQTPVTPEITATNADCDNENGSITVTNYDSNLTYILVNSQGDTQYAINESGVFTEVAPDSYTVRVENTDCNATSASATIEDSEQTPVTPEITATNADCDNGNGSITVANYDSNLTYILVNSQGDTQYAINESGVFTEVAPDSYTVRVENADCNATSASATIEDSEQTPVTPEITATNADCDNENGSITVANYDSNLTYILVNSQGDTQYAINESGVFTEVAPDSYTVRVENTDCNATSASATIEDSEQTPVTPEITATNADCDNENGSITVANYDSNLTYILINSQGDTQYAINESGVFTEVAPDSYTVRVENADCNATSASATIEDSEQTPVTPEITATNADCDNENGSIAVANYDSNLTYILVNSQGDTQYAINESGVFTEVAPDSYTVRVENADCNATSASATIEDSEQTPVTPEITATNADCDNENGSITVANYDSNLTYILVNSQGDTQYAINQSGVFTEVAPDSYTVRVENADCNATSASATIEDSEQTPVTPEITATDADCESNGSVTVTNYDNTLTYFLVDNGTDTEYTLNENGAFPDVAPGAYTVRVENADCNATSLSATVAASEGTPVTPEITATNADCDNENGSIAVTNYDSNLTYILVNSQGDTQYAINESGVFTEVAPDSYTVRVENADCNATSASATIEDSEQTPVTPEITATNADCDNENGSITVANYDSNLTYILVNSQGDTQYAINESGVFTEVAPDSYTVRVENADCNATSASATIEDSEQTPVTPEITATNADCDNENGSITVANYDSNLTYILVNSQGDTQYAINESGVFTEVAPDSYTVRVENADCNATSASATIEDSEQTPVTPEITATNADCDNENGSITVANYDSNLTYILINSQGDTQYAINESGVFTEVAPDSYTVRVENADCNATSASATIEDSEQTPVTPEITATDADCESNGSVTVTNYDNTLTYFLVDNGTDTEYTLNENGAFPDVAPGAYTVRVENADCNATSLSATVAASEGTPVTPEITATNADCDNENGSIAVANYDSNLTYILVNSQGDTQYAINESGVFTEVAPDSYTVRVENADCNATSASATIEDSEQTPVTPEITATNADCDNENGSITVANYDSNLTYILVNSQGDTQYAINESGVFTEVAPDSYTVRVENTDCNATSASATIEDSEQTPVTPEITATNADCDNENGSITVANYDSNLTYILINSQGDTQYAINESGVFTEVAPDSYTVRVENTDCNATSASATIEDSEQTPVTPEITATNADCDNENGSITVANYDSNLTYILVNSQGDTQYAINESGVFTEVAPDSYTVRVENTDCNATSASATIEDSEQTPVTPEITATNADCDNENGSIAVANYDSNLTYILVNSQGDTQYAINESGVFTEVAPDSYTVRVENADCNATSASATIEDSEQTPVTPEITATNADCDNENGSITVANYDSNLTYILVNSQGDTQYAINQSGVFTEVAPDSYTVRVENADCNATSASATIEDSEQTPVTPEITATNADCDNENGSITVANYDSNLTYILVNSQGDTQYAINESGVFTEVAPDSYTVRVENADCNATSASATIEDSEQTPVTPEITATNADCDNENGSITVANYDSNLTYILVNSQGDTQYAINESGVFTEVAPDSYTVRVENTDCNATSASATIEDSEQTPAAPVVASTTQPTCDDATGSFSITAVEALEYSINGGAYSATTSFEGLGAGTYNVTARNADGCESSSTEVTINQQPATPAAPVVASTTQPTCDAATGSFSITAVEGLEYSINGGAYSATTSFEGLGAGTYNVTARNADGCESSSTEVTINQQPATPVAPVVASTTQPTCDATTGSFSITAVEGLEYRINGGAYSATTSFEGLGAGTYNVTARSAEGCESASAEITINEVSDKPSAPVITATVQPNCEVATGSITVESQEGLSYSINGTDYQESGAFTDVAPGSYNITARAGNGCESESVNVMLEESQSTEVIQTIPGDLCIGDATFDLFELLTGDYDDSGSWEDQDQNGALTAGRIDPALLSVGIYTYYYVIGGGCPSTTAVTVNINDDCIVLPCGIDDIKDSISKVVTPYQDNYNDHFEIGLDIDCGFTYNLQIFNRWGSEVYSQRNYQNNWNGTSNKSVSSSDQLPAGTYFYILEINEGGLEPIQGYIYLGTK